MNNKGYIFSLYIMSQTVSIISNTNPIISKLIKNRYSTTNVIDNNYYQMIIDNEKLKERRKKLEKIIKNK